MACPVLLKPLPIHELRVDRIALSREMMYKKYMCSLRIKRSGQTNSQNYIDNLKTINLKPRSSCVF